MTLHDLFAGVEVVAMNAAPSLAVSGLQYDSRRVLPGHVFFAIAGAKTDGHRYVQAARERGAIAVASEGPADSVGSSPWVQIRSVRRALAEAAGNFYGHPSRQLAVVGITGTNGKTTTSFLLHAILEAAGKNAGLFGTIEYRIGSRRLTAPNTTPESLDLQAMFADLRDSGGTHAVMEVSSHALALDRVHGTRFRVAVFTNLTRDHLDFHGTMEEYFEAKKLLFTSPPPEFAVLNADDPYSAKLAGLSLEISYGVDARRADVREEAGAILTPAGAIANRSKLVGRTNSYNRLAAVAAAVALGIPNATIERGLELLTAVPGRFESVDAGQPFHVIVDYAHTDDALRNVLATARLMQPKRVITVFGCGGDRDRKKRPMMGEAAARLSDLVIVTSDNPRSESPGAIIEEILPGIERVGTPYHVVPDRGIAIALAIHEAKPGDLVLLAGKGHETYQVIGDDTIPFDDRKVALEELRKC